MNTCFNQSDPDYSRYASMMEGLRGRPTSLSIATEDRKYIHAEEKYGRTAGLMSYFRAGLQTADAVRQLISWHFGGEVTPKRFLDFACGYGRCTRFWDPGDEVIASDIRLDAIEFVGEQFGVRTILSTAKPEGFRPGVLFDCIYTGSLFSHLPEVSFTRWLWKLYSLLAPGGLLIFSVHGEAMLPAGETMPASGIRFTPVKDLPSADLKEYGDTLVSDRFVVTAIAAVTGRPTHNKVPQGLSFSQDLYVIAKGKLKEAAIPFQFGPIGCVDFGRWTDPERFKVTGWAFDKSPGEQVTAVEVYYNGELKGSCPVSGLRPDVAAVLGCSEQPQAVRCGWECVVEIPDRAADPEQDWLMVKARSSSGRQFVMMLDHPATLKEFEAPQGWTYSQSAEDVDTITSAVRYVYLPHNGRFTTDNPELSGWIATTNGAELVHVRLEGRFGKIPFTRVDRPDVTESMPGLVALGFEARLPEEYFAAEDPRLRFVTQSGSVLCALDMKVEPEVWRARQNEPKLLAMAEAR